MDILRLMGRRWWLVLGASLAVAVAVFSWQSARSRVYEAEAVIDVVSGAAVTEEDLVITTGRFAALAGTTRILESGVDSSELDISVATARARISADPAEAVGLVTVRAEGPSPSSAEALADGVVEALIADSEEATEPVDGEDAAPAARVVTPATASSDAIEPRPVRDALLALVIALFGFAVLVALHGAFTGGLPRGRLRDEVERMTESRVLVQIPRRGREEVVEAFRELRAHVEFARGDADIRTIAVTAVDPGDGASWIARGLSQVSANLKASVVLVDSNLRRPAVATELRLPPSPGLGDVLLGGSFDTGWLRQANPLQRRFRVLTAGLAVPDAPGLLGAGALRKILDQIVEAEIVVIDTPAVSEAADALVIAAQVDALILVVDARSTRRWALQDAMRRLAPHARFLGTVINRDDPARSTRRRRR